MHLTVSNWPVPDRGWEYVFRGGQQLPALQQLWLKCEDCPRLSRADLGRLVACCPNLRELSQTHALGPSDVAHLQPLLSLSQLTKLTLDHPWNDLTVLPQLTGLHDLSISTITESELLRLSVALTACYMAQCLGVLPHICSLHRQTTHSMATGPTGGTPESAVIFTFNVNNVSARLRATYAWLVSRMYSVTERLGHQLRLPQSRMVYYSMFVASTVLPLSKLTESHVA